MRFVLQRTMLIGVITGILVFFGVHVVDTDELGTSLVIVLAVIASLYPGSLLASGNTQATPVIAQEFAAAAFTYLFVVLGTVVASWWVIPGYIWHGLWDWAHHNNRCGARVVSWYPPWCAGVDFAIGGLAFVWLVVL
ncbi:MAG: hypothetical protein AAFP99_07770 [Pseudomonadota bacterium]